MTKSCYPMQEVWIRLEEGRTLYSPEKIETPDKAVAIMQEEMSRYDREVVLIVNLNNANQPINFNMVSMGTINASLIDAGNVLKSAILSNAAGFIILHNHPSGQLSPSPEDIKITSRLILAGALMDIPCLDHVIVAGNGKETYSMRENKDLDFNPGYDEMMEGARDVVAEQSAAYETPYNEVDQAEQRPPETRQREEVTLRFGKGLCQFFQSKKGEEMARIKIPNTPFESWPSFVVPARIVHDNQFGKGLWMKLPADGKTSLTISRRVTLEDGTQSWKDKRLMVENRKLKEMVEAYKDKPRDEQPEPEKIDREEPNKQRGR